MKFERNEIRALAQVSVGLLVLVAGLFIGVIAIPTPQGLGILLGAFPGMLIMAHGCCYC